MCYLRGLYHKAKGLFQYVVNMFGSLNHVRLHDTTFVKATVIELNWEDM